MKAICIALFLTCVFTTVGYAQLVTGKIVGTVKDSSGASLPGAVITVTNTDKNAVLRNVKTDAHGDYSAELLPTGKYSVTAEAPNFKTTSATGITLDVNQSVTINLVMQVGVPNQSVTVEAAALQVNLQDAQAQTVITGQQIQELAINTRNYEQLVALMPGVSQDTSDQLYLGVSNPVGTSNQINFSVNGGRPTQNSWLLDGADNVDRGANLTLLAYPSVDSISEFSVQRGQYGAEYGRSSAGMINVITKSGTNAFHGNLYEFFRNDIFQANNYILNRSGVKRPTLRYNDFGGTIGGPIIHDKLFFFFSEEVRRVVTHTAFLASVPTAAERAGTFATPVCLDAQCTSTGTQVTKFSPAAQAYLKDIFNKIPLPAADCVISCTIATAGRNIFNARQEIVRIDQVFSPRFTLFGRYENDTIPTQEPGGLFRGSNLPGVSNTTTNSPGRIFIVHATNTFGANLLNDVGFSYSHGGVISNPVGLGTTKNSPDIASTIKLPFTSTLGRVPELQFQNFENVNHSFGPYRDFNDNYSAFDNVSKVVGRHTFQFGGTYNHYKKDENAGDGNQGIFNSFNCTAAACTDGEYQEFANFLEGNASQFSQTSKDFRAVIRQQEFEFYGQDQFRWRPNVTLSYGLRYSLFRQPTDANGNLTTFDPAKYVAGNAPEIDPTGNNLIPGTGDPLNGIIIGGKNSPFGDAIARQNNKNFGPRVGIAWDPYKNGQTSVRAGYGLYYDSPSVNPYETAVFNNPPFVNSANIFTTTLDNPGGVSATPNLGLPVLSGTSADYKQPYVQEWSLDVQQQLMPNLLLDVGYYGSKGTHLLGIADINEPPVGLYVTALGLKPPITFGTTSLLNLIRPFRGYDAMNITSTFFISSYHSLQVAAQKRFGNNSQLSVNYTWSKTLTDANGDFSTPLVTSQPKLDYGPAQFDRRNIFNANYVYNLPFFQTQSGFVGHVLGGWELSGIVIAQSGLPFTATEGINDPAGVGNLGNSPSSGRPDQIGNPNSGGPRTFAKWFNTKAFAQVPNGQVRIGNARHGSILGPGTERWDLSLDKNTRISERVRLQFRAEAFNAFNHTNFNHILVRSTSSSFGRVSTVSDPRVLQLGLKLYF